ncbi:hypothetical protein ACIQMP_07785 [Streptomyces sp. NPDC091385]|uniref:zinc finger domain-containing protein n=1 Tax=Streptomyces sp. NPDC091385 TaxID=3365997 RepID=UPI00380A5F40
MNDHEFETDAEAQHADLHDGKRITLEELETHLSAVDLRLRQLARAAETPETPVELERLIESMRTAAGQVRRLATDVGQLAAIIDGRTVLSKTFSSGDGWGSAAVGTDRETFGGPAIIPTEPQLQLLADQAKWKDEDGQTTYREAMAGVPRSLLLSWESKAAGARREREREAAVRKEVLKLGCERCGSGVGQRCKAKSGWEAEQPHAARLKEARARVDERLGYLGPNPVAVPDA